MKNLNQIKTELQAFEKKYNACEERLNAIKGNTLIELFKNINIYIHLYKEDEIKTKEFNDIFNNELVIEDNVLLCNCTKLNSIIIPNFITSIDDYAFFCCYELTEIEIPNSVTSIGKYTFYGCVGLKSIKIPNSVTSIGKYTFTCCYRLKSIVLPNLLSYHWQLLLYGLDLK